MERLQGGVRELSEFVSTGIAAHAVAEKTFRGAVAIGVRQIVVQGSRILGGIFLARLLTPGEFGFYAIILYFQTFLTAFGDAGLAASLVRQHEEPESVEYRAIFTVQQLFVLATSLVLWFVSPFIAACYHLPPHDAWMFRLVLLSFVATSFMVIPQVRMERHLAFDSLALIESTQAIVFNFSAVYFAWRGWGGYSFAWALLLRSVLGAVLANRISPWRIGWHWDWSIVRSHLSFGLAYQGMQVSSLLKDSITPVLIGIMLGATGVGYVTWATVTAAYPALVLFVLQRLYMPAFARLQDHAAQLVALSENVIWATNVITAPLATITLAMIVPITVTVYGAKWLVALPYFYLLWPANLFVASATPTLGLVNALGKSKIAFNYALIWMAGTWVIGAPLIWLYGPIGFPIANLIVQFSNLWLFRTGQRLVPFRLYSIILPVWGVASVSGLLVYLACRFYTPSSVPGVIVYGVLGLLLYIGGLYPLYGIRMRTAWKLLRAAE